MGYYMLFEHSPGDDLDTPLGIHITREDVNALCVFSSSEVAAAARDAAAPGYYLEAVAPDDVVSLAAIHGVDVVALDAYSENPVTLMRTVDAAEALTVLASYQA
jgi:hypothetical protein